MEIKQITKEEALKLIDAIQSDYITIMCDKNITKGDQKWIT